LPGATGADERDEQHKSDNQVIRSGISFEAIHRLEFYLSRHPFSSKAVG